MPDRYYNIHDIVKFKITTNESDWKLKNIYGHYKNFEISKTDTLDFVVHLGKFIPSNEDCCIIKDKYYIKWDYFYCKRDSYKFTEWEFEMSGFENGSTVIRISSNFPGYMWMSGFIVEFLIHYTLNEKGYSIIHASCVSIENNGIAFAARGGGGKTTIAMNLVERGYKLLGDNFVILSNGYVLSYLSPLNIFTYNLLPIVQKKINFRNKIELKLKQIIYQLTGRYVKIFTKLNPCDTFPMLTINKTKLDMLFLVVPKSEIDSLLFKKVDVADLYDRLVLNQMLDTLLFLPYIAEYSYIFPESKLSKYWKKYRDNLINNIPSDVLAYVVGSKQRFDDNIINKIINMISENLSDI